MFIGFFYHLKSWKIPVSTSELLDLLKSLDGLSECIDFAFTPRKFYEVARTCLIKDIKHYDQYDMAFSSYFKEILQEENGSSNLFKSKLEEWLNQAKNFMLDEKRKKNALNIPTQDLMKELQKRLEEQKKRHDGGNKWVGTGGTSPYGNSGYNPNGIRVGGDSQSKSALAVAGERRFQEYSHDEVLDIRQVKMALKNLRDLKKQGRYELSIPKTIDNTCNNNGDIDLVFERLRKNNLKVLLIMDVGGSMTPFSKLVEKLFSASHQLNHFKEFKHFYFHNIIYDHVFKTSYMDFEKSFKIKDLLNKYDSETRVIYVGDACMAPYELFNMNGQTFHFYRYLDEAKADESPVAINQLHKLKEHFPKSVWLNPEKQMYWQHTTILAIKKVIPMYPLTLNGLIKSISCLID
jgi:uncharacterized protein